MPRDKCLRRICGGVGGVRGCSWHGFVLVSGGIDGGSSIGITDVGETACLILIVLIGEGVLLGRERFKMMYLWQAGHADFSSPLADLAC